GGGGGGGTGDGKATVYSIPGSVDVAVSQSFTVDLYIHTTDEAQAFEFDVAMDPARMVPVSVVPHPDFDDDSQWFVPPTIDAGQGTIRGIVDVRHGAPAATGVFQVATVTIQATNPGSGVVQFQNGGIADPNGDDLTLTIFATLVNVTP
ncbi:MAG: cohesin domain-containing protein, partial [Proteobacteria bacterium]|nr:cohesin domain-containing protein [Pseudomonadota bacterium]